jgi:hypothetical protein
LGLNFITSQTPWKRIRTKQSNMPFTLQWQECWNDKNNRRQNLQNATAIFNDRTGCDISSRTVCRRFVQYGYEHRVFSKKITIYPVNHKRRLGFCRRKWHWTVQNQWSSVIFSDETKIVLGQTHKIYVWRRPDERMRPDCLGLNDDCETNSRASVMFCGWISYYSERTLVSVEGNMNTEKHISVLDDNL